MKIYLAMKFNSCDFYEEIISAHKSYALAEQVLRKKYDDALFEFFRFKQPKEEKPVIIFKKEGKVEVEIYCGKYYVRELEVYEDN